MWVRFATRVSKRSRSTRRNIASKSRFRWTTDFNISFIRNELRALAGGAKEMMTTASWNSDYTGYDYTARIGQSLGLIYGYVFDGVYQTSDFNVNAATGEYVLKEGVTDITDHAGVAVKPGMVKYKDTDGDGVITTADRTVIGNGTPRNGTAVSPIPCRTRAWT